MNPARLVFVFAICLVLKVSLAAGATPPAEANEDVALEPVATSPMLASNAGSAEADAATVLGTKSRRAEHGARVGVMPMVGGAIFTGPWRRSIHNSYTAGLILDVPMTSHLSAELEGSYGDYRMSYGAGVPVGPQSGHDFQIWSVGGNLKATLSRSFLQPYLGAGIHGLFYDGMRYSPYAPFRYSRWIGAGQLIGGMDIALMESVSLGGRAAYVHPLFNTLGPADRQFYSADAGALAQAHMKLMGTLRVAF